jgi:hypothetical protein
MVIEHIVSCISIETPEIGRRCESRLSDQYVHEHIFDTYGTST